MTPDEMVLDVLRKGPLWELSDNVWETVVKEVQRANGINATTGTVREILVFGMEKAAKTFGGNRSEAGRYAAQQRWLNHTPQGGAGGGRTMAERQGGMRGGAAGGAMPPQGPDVIARTPEEALEALQQGKTVQFTDIARVNTLIEKLADFAEKAKKGGKELKLNLCQVSIPGTNLFCGESLRGPDGKPLPRDVMPQLGGIPKKGSPADDEKKFPKNNVGGVDIGPAFEQHLAEKGVAVKRASVPAASLKASQAELKSSSVAFLMSPEGRKKMEDMGGTIYVSRDGYVIDGHHRWAALVGIDTEDGKIGQTPIQVTVVDMPIREVLKEAGTFADVMGIERKTI
jgi:hypothetical protein